MYDRRDLGVWIGLRDSGDWTWVDQEVATWTNWAPGEPANVDITWHNKRTEYVDNIRSTLSFLEKLNLIMMSRVFL